MNPTTTTATATATETVAVETVAVEDGAAPGRRSGVRRLALRTAGAVVGAAATLALMAAPASAGGWSTSNSNGWAAAWCNSYGNVVVQIDPSRWTAYSKYSVAWKTVNGYTISTGSDTDLVLSSGNHQFDRKYGPNHASYASITPQYENSISGGWYSMPTIHVYCN